MSHYGKDEYYKELLNYYVKDLPKKQLPIQPRGMSVTEQDLLMLRAAREAEEVKGVKDNPFNPKPIDFNAYLAEMEKMEQLKTEKEARRAERHQKRRNPWNNGRGNQKAGRKMSWLDGLDIKDEKEVFSTLSKDQNHRNDSGEIQVFDKIDNAAAGPSFEKDLKPAEEQIGAKKIMEKPKNPNVTTVLVPDGNGKFREIQRVKVRNPKHSDYYRPKPTKAPALPPVNSDYDKLTPDEKRKRFMKDLNPKAVRKNQPNVAPRFAQDSESRQDDDSESRQDDDSESRQDDDSESSKEEDSPAPSTSNHRRRPRTPVNSRVESSSESDEPRRKKRPEVIVEEIEVDEEELPPIKTEVKPENGEFVNPLQSLIDFISKSDALTDNVPEFLEPPIIKMHWIEGGKAFKNRSVVQMDKVLYRALEEAHKTKANSLFIVEGPLHCLNATALKKGGGILCKMNHFYRPHFLPDVLEDIPKRLGRSIEHVFITLTHNALFNLDMIEDREADTELANTMFHSVDNRKPLADVFENLPQIIKSLVKKFKLKQVVIIVPPTCKDSDLLQRLRNRFIGAIESNNYLKNHVFYADFHSYCLTSDVKPCAAGLQQFLRNYFTIYGINWLHLKQ